MENVSPPSHKYLYICKNLLCFTFSHFFLKVKDESIVRLTNQIHEMELKTVVTLSTSVPPSPRLNTPGNFTEKIS